MWSAILITSLLWVVGHEGVLSTSNSKQLRCGNRLVTGLFTTPHLPLGYSYITTVPTGACRLNITELQPSENYIALKVSNGSFIMNGGFAVSSPGSYEAVGAQFTYVRTAGVAESIYTAGPIHRPLDIMILYRHPYPVIKYEYFTDITIEDEKQNEIERTQQKQKHHNNDLPQAGATETAAHPNLDVFQRRFSYKSVGYTKCTKTCGGGIQVTKWKCLEEVTNAEASSTQCPGDPPPARRRHCNTHPCAGKWRLGIWSDCPKCGPAESVRKVTCIKEHSRSITPVKDAECDGQKPITSRRCDIPNCDSIKQERDDLPTMVNARRQARPKIESFQDKPVIYTQDNATKYDSNEIPSISSFKTGDSIFGEWLHSDWTECMGWCGNGVRSRNVVCSSSSGKCMNPEPAAYESCSIRAQCQPATPQPLWLTGPWSQCSSPCSWGRRVRVVVCASSLGRRLRDSACLTLPKPLTVESCRASGICSDDWIVGEWSECPCRAQGDVSTQRRTVRCNGHTCTSSKPIQVRACDVGSTCPINQLSPPISQTPGRPTPVLPTPITDIPRTTRNEIPFKAQTSTSTSTELNLNDGSCENKLTSCSLAVQARLCQYPYYVKYCCRSCKNAIP